jgi:hypothetical protein
MSKAPRVETHPGRDPVASTSKALAVLQSRVPSSGPGSGVPATAACHSAFVGRRLAAFVHACCAWNQAMKAEGSPPGG